jgi:hypothetical protein
MIEPTGGTVDPVFLDRSGRRRRWFVAAGTAGGLLLSTAALALVAGFTGAGPGSVPGWPGGADDRSVDRPESAVSVRPPATRRAPRPPATTEVERTTAPAVAVPTTSKAPTADPSVNPHRRVPTHTPNPRKSKDK